MNSGDVWICAACGSRNKPRWEYCARCGESAHDAAPDAPTLIVEDADADLAEPAQPAESAGPGMLGTLSGVLALGAALWWSVSEAGTRAPERPDPGLFVLATVPPEPPVSPKRVVEQESDFARGMALLARGDLEGALSLLAAASDAEPENATYQNAYGKALWAAGRRDEAIGRLEVAWRLAPGVTNGLDLAKARDAAGQGAEAAALYEQVLASQPGHEETLEALGSLYARTGQADSAVRVWRALAERRPQDALVAQYLGQALEAGGDLDGAVQAYRQVLSRVPHATVTRGTLAEALFKQGRTDEALAVYQEGLQRDAAAPALYRGMGTVLERAGRLTEAAAAYREYGRLSPGAADAAQVQEHAGRLEQAAGGASS